ncbi:MAG: response regulator [Methylococcaceae bacterium]
MSPSSNMKPVNPSDIQHDSPLPYDVYSVDGALLYSAGEIASLPEQIAIMSATGWRIIAGSSGPEFSHGVHNDTIHTPLEIPLLPLRERPLLDQAEVLIAEDMSLARNLLIRMLNEQGVTRIHSVDNGHSAITHYFKYRPHIVFLDIYMPPSNGFDVLRQIKAWCPGNFVCMASGDCTQANAEQSRALGVNAYIIKPISPLNLKRVLALYTNK